VGHGTPEDVAAKVRGDGGIPDDQAVGDIQEAMMYLRSLPYLIGKVDVYATGASGDSAFSNEATAATPPNAPTNLTATTGRRGNQARVILSWTDSSFTETGFTIQYSTDSTFKTNVTTVNLAANSPSFNTGNVLPRNTTYFFRIQAVNGSGSSAWVSISITTP
jgi:predicted phage tail protein